MNRIFLNIFVFVLLSGSGQLYAQENRQTFLDSLFNKEKEVYFTFESPGKDRLNDLTKMISLDNLNGNTVYAYANRTEFTRFLALGLTYEILPHPGDLLAPSQLGTNNTDGNGRTTWNFYPNYQEYLDFMNDFVTEHPTLCQLVTIGTSEQGRQIIAVKISDNVGDEEAEPEFLYTSSIHGDELTGYVLMLHLIDHMLTNYGTDPQITDIIDNTEIYINPLSNPDGTFYGGNNSVYGARRYNANGIDLNRNYPDPADGPHPDGNEWQVETEAFMAFADSNDFVMGANFHGGAEVFNYPWDTWQREAADDDWWKFVGHEYVDTVQEYAPSTYFSGFDDGISNGYAWYRITGGRQDYMNYWHSSREVTLEISDVKLIPASQLLTYWEYNYRSLLNYLDQVSYGLHGFITDSVTGEPLEAKVFIFNFDKDNSYVYSKLPSGYYSRLLIEGDYNVSYICQGYFSKVISNTIQNRTRTECDVPLVPLNIGIPGGSGSLRLHAFPNPTKGVFYLVSPTPGPESARITCVNSSGSIVFQSELRHTEEPLRIDLTGLSAGLYHVTLTESGAMYSTNIMVY